MTHFPLPQVPEPDIFSEDYALNWGVRAAYFWAIAPDRRFNLSCGVGRWAGIGDHEPVV